MHVHPFDKPFETGAATSCMCVYEIGAVEGGRSGVLCFEWSGCQSFGPASAASDECHQAKSFDESRLGRQMGVLHGAEDGGRRPSRSGHTHLVSASEGLLCDQSLVESDEPELLQCIVNEPADE